MPLVDPFNPSLSESLMASTSISWIDDEDINIYNTCSSSYLNTVCLQDWWLIKAEKEINGKRLAVEGLTREQRTVRVFSSTPIIKRYDIFTLQTADGITIILKRSINKFRTMENGFSFKVCNDFLLGFPYYWESYVDKLFEETLVCGNVPSSVYGLHELTMLPTVHQCIGGIASITTQDHLTSIPDVSGNHMLIESSHVDELEECIHHDLENPSADILSSRPTVMGDSSHDRTPCKVKCKSELNYDGDEGLLHVIDEEGMENEGKIVINKTDNLSLEVCYEHQSNVLKSSHIKQEVGNFADELHINSEWNPESHDYVLHVTVDETMKREVRSVLNMHDNLCLEICYEHQSNVLKSSYIKQEVVNFADELHLNSEWNHESHDYVLHVTADETMKHEVRSVSNMHDNLVCHSCDELDDCTDDILVLEVNRGVVKSSDAELLKSMDAPIDKENDGKVEETSRNEGYLLSNKQDGLNDDVCDEPGSNILEESFPNAEVKVSRSSNIQALATNETSIAKGYGGTANVLNISKQITGHSLKELKNCDPALDDLAGLSVKLSRSIVGNGVPAEKVGITLSGLPKKSDDKRQGKKRKVGSLKNKCTTLCSLVPQECEADKVSLLHGTIGGGGTSSLPNVSSDASVEKHGSMLPNQVLSNCSSKLRKCNEIKVEDDSLKKLSVPIDVNDANPSEVNMILTVDLNSPSVGLGISTSSQKDFSKTYFKKKDFSKTIGNCKGETSANISCSYYTGEESPQTNHLLSSVIIGAVTNASSRSDVDCSGSGEQGKSFRSSLSLGDVEQAGEQLEDQEKCENNKTPGRNRKRKVFTPSPTTPARRVDLGLVTPEHTSYGRSRSGRLLVPPLDFWRHQQVVYDRDGRITGIQNGLPLLESSTGSESATRKTKRKLI